jgi:hypothetical protein
MNPIGYYGLDLLVLLDQLVMALMCGRYLLGLALSNISFHKGKLSTIYYLYD